MNCPYCGALVKDGDQKCSGCGSLVGLMVRGENDQIERGQPFYYNGYIVWTMLERGFRYDTYEWQFWLGDKIVETISFSREMREELFPQGSDPMPFIWDLFKMAQGETEVLRITRQNWRGNRPADFLITHIPTEREAYAESMTKEKVIDAINEGLRDFG